MNKSLSFYTTFKMKMIHCLELLTGSSQQWCRVLLLDMSGSAVGELYLVDVDLLLILFLLLQEVLVLLDDELGQHALGQRGGLCAVKGAVPLQFGPHAGRAALLHGQRRRRVHRRRARTCREKNTISHVCTFIYGSCRRDMAKGANVTVTTKQGS